MIHDISLIDLILALIGQNVTLIQCLIAKSVPHVKVDNLASLTWNIHLCNKVIFHAGNDLAERFKTMI